MPRSASAELVAMCTVGTADHFGLPVSTTHVLSSGVAGTMLANHSGLQTKTLRNLMLAWVLTLPVCIFQKRHAFLGRFVHRPEDSSLRRLGGGLASAWQVLAVAGAAVVPPGRRHPPQPCRA